MGQMLAVGNQPPTMPIDHRRQRFHNDQPLDLFVL
jgi:hypothetical protein